MIYRRFLIIVTFFTSMLSCSTVRFIKSLDNTHQSRAYHTFHQVGLFGPSKFDGPLSTKKICKDKDFLYLQTENSIIDSIVGLITLNMYSPVSVKIVCSLKSTSQTREVASTGFFVTKKVKNLDLK